MDDAVVEWFDSHCHLQRSFGDEPAADGDDPIGEKPHATALSAALARASEAGVTRMVCVGTGERSSSEAVELVRSERRPGSVARAEGVEVWATVGLHPHDAVDGVEVLDAVLADAVRGGPAAEPAMPERGTSEGKVPDLPTVVAIGECGLDYHYDHSPRAVQREVFARQVDLAHRCGMALVIHTREAWDDTVSVLESTGVPERTVVHCFTGGPDEARRCLDLGAVLSFSGVVTFKSADEVRAAAAFCPLDRLLVETDAPFLSPVPHRGTPNEPSRVPLVGTAVAGAKGLGVEQVAAATLANARRIFRV
ncbi:MAG: TatD family hydrolase [Acidimicrobiales bacterium]